MEQGSKATFEAAMERVLVNECLPLGVQRGQEYSDSWSLENVVTTFMKATLKRLFGIDATLEELRLCIAAGLVDVKDQRIGAGGPWKLDSAIDGINYRCLYTDLRGQYEAHHPDNANKTI